MGQHNVSNGHMWHCGVYVAYPQLSDWSCLQWALCSLIFGVQHSDFLEVETNVEIHNNSLLDESKIESLYLVVGRIIDNFHFFHCSSANFGG